MIKQPVSLFNHLVNFSKFIIGKLTTFTIFGYKITNTRKPYA